VERIGFKAAEAGRLNASDRTGVCSGGSRRGLPVLWCWISRPGRTCGSCGSYVTAARGTSGQPVASRVRQLIWCIVLAFASRLRLVASAPEERLTGRGWHMACPTAVSREEARNATMGMGLMAVVGGCGVDVRGLGMGSTWGWTGFHGVFLECTRDCQLKRAGVVCGSVRCRRPLALTGLFGGMLVGGG